VFLSSHTTPGLSLAAVLLSNIRQQQQPQPLSDAQAYPATMGEMISPPPLRHIQQKVLSRSVQAANANSSPLNDMFTIVATICQQNMTELNGAESEADRTMAITRIVLKVMKKIGRNNSWAPKFRVIQFECLGEAAL
jgi:hypothetical protein